MRGLTAIAVMTAITACAAAIDRSEPSPAIAASDGRDAGVGDAALAIDAAPAVTADGGGPRSLDDALAARAVTDDDFYRPVLYTWSTPEAAASLRASHQLLVATAATGTFVSPLNRSLAVAARRPGPGQAVARLLTTHPALVRRRYAWPAPFATVLGLGRHGYGTALVRIELAPAAWIGRFDPAAAEPFRFVDRAGAVVPIADVVAAPERIGAIFHVRTEPWLAAPFREYVVCSAAMVAAWSIGTTAIAEQVADDRAMVAQLAAASPPRSSGSSARARAAVIDAWSGRATRDELGVRWRAALAFGTHRYRPAPTNLAAIDAALAAYDPTGPPLEITAAP